MTPAEARALWRSRKTKQRARVTAVRRAKAEARARRLVDMDEAGLSHEAIAAELGIKLTSVRGAIRAARIRLASDGRERP